MADEQKQSAQADDAKPAVDEVVEETMVAEAADGADTAADVTEAAAVEETVEGDGAAEGDADAADAADAKGDGGERAKSSKSSKKAKGDEDDEPASERFDKDDEPTLAEAATYEEDDEIPLGKIQDVLNATADTSNMTPQMKRMMQRQADNTKRVQESIKGTKANPSWYVPLFCALMIIGLVWAVVFYLTSNQYPIPGIGFWNLAIAFGFILVGFLMTVGWR